MKVFKFAKKILNRIAFLVRDIAFETVHRFQGASSSFSKKANKTAEDSRFIRLNKKYWQSIDASENNGIVLVEGFFASAGHNYLLRTGMLAKAIQSKVNCEIAILFDKPSYKLTNEKEKYQSFGINRFLYIKPGLASFARYLWAVIFGIKYFFSLRCADDISTISHDQILLGDLIYDDLLKSGKNKYTIEDVDFVLLKRLIQSFYYYFSYKSLFNSNAIKYVIVSHLVYAQYGILARIALRYKIDVIETTDLMMNYISAHSYSNRIISPTYHGVLKGKINEYLATHLDHSALVEAAEKELKRRMTGSVEQFDARFAYQNKVSLTKEEFRTRLGIPSNQQKPIMIIFAHIFTDAPHCSENLLFRDYYQWLVNTIEYVREVQDVNWIIKPHPASKVYGEEGVVFDLIESAQLQSSQRNIFLYPEGVTAANLPEIANGIVTVQGTAGIEFSCLAVPTILAGGAFYANEGFTYDPKTREEYFSLLKNAHKIQRLNQDQIYRAKKIYAAYNHILSVHSNLIPSTALDAIWGYGEGKSSDIDYGNKIINDLLEINDPKMELQYTRLQEYLG